jgi:hypothetical protein
MKLRTHLKRSFSTSTNLFNSCVAALFQDGSRQTLSNWKRTWLQSSPQEIHALTGRRSPEPRRPLGNGRGHAPRRPRERRDLEANQRVARVVEADARGRRDLRPGAQAATTPSRRLTLENRPQTAGRERGPPGRRSRSQGQGHQRRNRETIGNKQRLNAGGKPQIFIARWTRCRGVLRMATILNRLHA